MSFINSLLPTRNGHDEPPAASRPRHEVTETDDAFLLTVSLPGVSREGLEITDEGGQLTIRGKRAAAVPQGQNVVYRETGDSPFELAFVHDGSVDAGKIGAELRDGLLRLSLPKAESAKPRKIAVG
ncbi:MAG TPA: Hsp20/alpha crystallin family protein [Opitutaceae bacterium]|jgi:HSP20 family molecular chaperone IbpA